MTSFVIKREKKRFRYSLSFPYYVSYIFIYIYIYNKFNKIVYIIYTFVGITLKLGTKT